MPCVSGTHLLSTSCRGPTAYRAHAVVEKIHRIDPRPEHPRDAAISTLFFFSFSGSEARQRRRSMSSSATSSRREWPKFGPVPMTRCPDCPRTAPLKRLVTTTDVHGNLGHEFVKCESKPERGKVRFGIFWLQFRFLFEISSFSWIWDFGSEFE